MSELSPAFGERIVYGQRVLGRVRLADVPADGAARHYLIERGLTCMGERRAIVEDYTSPRLRPKSRIGSAGVENARIAHSCARGAWSA